MNEPVTSWPLASSYTQRSPNTWPALCTTPPITWPSTSVRYIGMPMNLTLVEGQVMGGVVQSAGHVFGERCVYDEASGQLVTGSFMDYPMPRAELVREFRLVDRSVPSPNNVLGAK